MVTDNQVLDTEQEVSPPTPVLGGEEPQVQADELESPTSNDPGAQPEPAPPTSEDNLQSQYDQLRAQFIDMQAQLMHSELTTAEQGFAKELQDKYGYMEDQAKVMASDQRQQAEETIRTQLSFQNTINRQQNAYTNAVSVAKEHGLGVDDLEQLIVAPTPEEMNWRADMIGRLKRAEEGTAAATRAPASQMDNGQGGVYGESGGSLLKDFGSGRRNGQDAYAAAFNMVRNIPGMEKYASRYVPRK